MYKISVPIVIPGPQLDDSREETIKDLRALGAKRVYLSPGRYITDKAQFEKILGIIKNEVEYFKSLGFEVGSWMWTLWAETL